MFGHETGYRSQKSKAFRFVKLSHTALIKKAGVGEVNYKLLRIVLQANHGKTSPLIFRTGMHAKKDDGVTSSCLPGAMHLGQECRRKHW